MQTVRIPGIGDVDFPDDMSHDQIAHAIEKEILPNYKAPTGGIVESAIGSAKRGIISAGTALKAPFGAEEAAKAGVEAEQAVTERPGFNWEEIKRKYEQEGLIPAAGEAISQIPGTVSEQAPTLASILAGGRIGAMGGGELGGMIGGVPGAAIGATIGGIGGAAMYPFLTQSGENIQRQYQEQVAKGETPDISLGKAYTAGAGGTALEMIGGPEAFLAKRLGKKTAEQIGKEELESLAKQGMVQGALRGTGRVMAEEIPTEMAQTALTRLQAGLPISPADQQALDEYLASGVGAALAGPVGGPMRIMESGAARATLAEQERKRQEEEAKKAEEDRIASLYGGQRTLPGFEGVEPQSPKTEEEEAVSSLQRAADYLRGLPQDFTNPSQVKKALEGTEFETVGPKKALDLYKTLPVQTQLFDEEGNLSAPAMQGYEQRQKATEAMGKKLEQAQPGETLDLFGKAAPITYQQEQPEAELPSQGGSANLMMQQAMKEAEQQTAIDQANRARQTLYGQSEAAPMGYESAERRALAIEESLPHQQRTLELQQQLQQQALAEQQKKAGEAMGKKLEQAKPGQTLDIFGKAHEADFTQPEAAQEIPSQGGSANLQIQEAIRQAELANDIEKANRLRQQLYATPEGQLLTPRQQQERIEAEPFKQAAEQKAADLKEAKEEGRLPETAITKETLTTLHPDLAKTAIGKRVASEPAKYYMNNAEGLNDVVKSLEAISTKKPDLAPSINPFLTNLKKHVEVLTGKQPEQAQEVGKLFSKSELPNLNANNQPIAQTPEAAKNFWNWFGDSKVTDAEGKPLVVYHGTTADITKFDPMKNGQKDSGWYGDGHYTTADPEAANAYADYDELKDKYVNPVSGQNVLPVYVSLKNPYFWPKDRKPATSREESLALTKELKAQGYDGVIVPNEYQAPEYAQHHEVVAFYPEQIKSAIGNRGTFSPEEGSIVKSKAAAPTNAHTKDSLQQALTKRYGNNAPKINIGTRADAQGDSTVQGFYDPATKSVTLIPENIDQSKDLHGLIRHEVAVHAKRFGKTDAEFQAILKQLNALKNNKAVKEAYARVPKDTAAENIDEEALGYLVEHAKQLPIVKRFMSWLRRMAHKLTGSSNWLRADDFAKLADEVLSSKTSTETSAQANLAPLYSKAQQRRAFDRPQTDVQSSYSVQSIKDRMNVKTDFEKGEIFNGVRSALNNIRKAASYQQAPIASKDYDKYLGQVQDADGKATSTAMIDSALDSDKIAANAYDTGKVVVDSSGVLKVVADKNNLDNLFTKVANFAKSIGDEEHGKNIVNRYLIARRYNNIIKNNADLERRAALETNKAQAKKLRDGIVKVTPEQAQETAEFIDLNKTYPQLNSIADMVDAIQMDLLDLMEKTGIVSKKDAEKYRNEKGYVPLYRIMDDLEKSNPGVKQYFGGLTDIGTEKAFHGSDRQALDVLDNIMARYSWAVQAASRNAALNRVAESYGVVGDDGKTKIYHSTPKVNPEFFIPMMQDGKKVWVEYADPSIPQALLPVQSIVNPLFKAMGTASRILRTGVTAIPTFGAAQVVMDAQRAALFSGVKNPFKLMSRVLTAYYDILKDPKFSTVERLHAYGISGGYGHTAEETNKRLRRKAGLDVTTKWNKLMDGADKFAAASDMAQRVAIYEQTMKETGDEMLALHRARNIINWRHRGDNAIVNTLTQIIPFANAYAQSMDVSLNAMMSSGISGKERKKAIKSFYWNTLMFAGLSTVYAMLVAGNDEYEKLSDREKLGSFFIPGTSELTGGNGSITIPVPNDIGFMFKILPELLINYVNKDSVKYPKDATKLASALGSSALDAITGPNLMPQAIKGVVEIATNHDFMTGNPIIGHGLERLEKFKQFTDSTSEVAKLLGKTNMISPMDADHLIKAYSGTIGSLGLLMIDKVVNQFSDNPKPETHLYKNPMVSRFLADPRYKSQIADYYDLLERSDKVTNTLKKIKEQDSPEEVTAYKEENKELLQTRRQVLNLQNQVSKIREQRNKIRDNKSLSAEEKSDKIEALDERTGRVLRNIEKLRLRAGL